MDQPVRTCVGCRRTDVQDQLVRHVVVDGQVVPDPARRMPGRGAWLHPDPQCAALAARKGGFARSFRRRVSPPPLEG